MLSVVISGRAEGANPESRYPRRAGLWIPGSLARSQVYAGCVNLPAMLAPRNDQGDS
jgi:hypothetical protein